MNLLQLRNLFAIDRLPQSPFAGMPDHASVLMPLFEKCGHAHVLAVLKADTEGYPWRNQVALPGGHVDEDDGNTLVTAFRELKEELNIDRDQVEVVGSLGFFQTIRATEIEAFVGVWNGDRSRLRIDPGEISMILEIPLAGLIRTHVESLYAGNRPGVASLVYPTGEKKQGDDIVVWGVTAMIFHYFLEHLRRLSPKDFTPESPSFEMEKRVSGRTVC